MAAEEGEKTPNKSPMPRQNMKASRKMETPKGKDGTAAEDEKEQQSSDKESKSAGMIFMCNSRTKQDCFHYKIFG
ncbi:hypothetical protein, partial [Streptomyces fildesensis]|uniref:hypothetical protein n=1 Tax=Streptomyces fildesensis TaxID=375757 RepID=UPI001E57B2DF